MASTNNDADELRKKIEAARNKTVPPYVEEPYLSQTENYSRYYIKLYRWDPEHDTTLHIAWLLEDLYGVDTGELREKAKQHFDPSKLTGKGKRRL